MSPLAETISIILYCVQQLGVMLGVGSQTMLLIADALASRDGAIDAKEEQFLHATKRVVYFSLACIISSGILITILHFDASQTAIVLQPAFLFKWMLIAVVTIFAILEMRSTPSQTFLKAAAGGSWYALFIVHILAPVSTWGLLLLLYGVWMVGFVTAWSSIVFVLRQSYAGASAQLAGAGTISQPIFMQRPVQKPVVQKPEPPSEPIVVEAPPPPPPVVKVEPTVPPPLPPPVAPPIPAPPTPTAPQFFIPESSEKFPYSATGSAPMLHPHLTNSTALAVDAVGGSGALASAQVTESLPAVRIMPQSQKDLDTQHRAPLVKFG